MKRRIHIDAIEAAINWIFCEQIKQSDLKETDTCLDAIGCFDNVNYVYRKINRRDKAELFRIARIKLSKYLKEHTDNTFEMFKSVNIKKSKDYQTYYPDWETNNKEKVIYVDLQTWIEVLEQLTFNEKNVRYSISDIIFENEYEYRNFKSLIEMNGCFNYTDENIKTFIYTPELAYVLTKEALNVINCDTKEVQKINGRDFLNDYVNGFIEGLEYFKKNHSVDNNVLYGTNAVHYVNDIHNNYFHIKHTGINNGWKYYKTSYPIILTKEQIKKYGFYAGIISEVEAMVNKHPEIFNNLEKCENEQNRCETEQKNSPPPQRENFENWIKLMQDGIQINKTDWSEVIFNYNTGKAYQHKQDLVACFWNSYIYYQQKFEVYFKEFNKIPYDVFNDLIFEFRQSFPKHGRIEGVNYFDDLIEQLIEKHTPLLKTLPTQQNENIDWINLFESIDIEKPFVAQVHITNTLEQKKNYFSKASFNLTFQYLQNFKKETYLLSNKRKAEYITGLNIVSPPIVKTGSSLNNQTIFEAQSNYFEFLEQFKIFLENGLATQTVANNNKENEDIPVEISRTKIIISKELETIDKTNGWEYAFTNESDYNTFLELLTNYFEYKPYSLPNKIIKLKRDCKTRFAKALSPIHKELSEFPLKSDTNFFKLIKVLNHFENLSDAEIYQAITR